MKSIVSAIFFFCAVSGIAQDQDAKELKVDDYFGLQKFNLADLKGRVVALEFWASW